MSLANVDGLAWSLSGSSPASHVAQRIGVAPWYGGLLQSEPISILGIFGVDFSFGGESIKNRWRAAYVCILGERAIRDQN